MSNQSQHMLAGRYEIGELIGRGGMAKVHIGYDTRLSRRVAIKLLREDLARDPVFLTRFRREAQSAAALNHSTIVGVYDTGEETMTAANGENYQVPYIIMEYVEGHTVRDLLQEGTAIPINEAVEIVDGVLLALEYAHRAGIVHRDIKPGNIMLTPTGDVKVMDFGIARAIADSQATMTQANSVVGTAQYLSPEQARGEVVDRRSDLYSTGCLLFELLTGQPPFTGDSAVAVAYQHVRETPRTPSSIASDIPEALDRVVLKSLAKDREQRYADAAEMRRDLRAAIHGGTVSAPSTAVWGVAGGLAPGAATALTTQMPQPTQAFDPLATHTTSTHPAVDSEPQKKSKAWLWALLATVVIGGGLIFALWMFNREPAEPPVEMVTVPSLQGFDQSAVTSALENAGLKPDIGEPVAHDSIPEGIFVQADPPEGTEVEKGTVVHVNLSSGPGEVTVPDVTGMTQDAARKTLEDKGLTISNVSSEDVPGKESDIAVKTEPAAGEQVEAGSAIRLVVASGYVEVPSLRGETLESATKILQDLKLSMNSETVESDEVSPGQVLDQNVSGRVPVNTTVNLQIAKAPPPPSPSSPPSSQPSPSNSPTPPDQDNDN
ncbi:MAG: Stk1 family PASTA domain-containing Ser/Thr kinase [Bowdeniella nasicola]|nr:Stk1 family PASTA domain-containing Ser/Thr kinase [Bowdeniella nasicola]